MMCKVTVIGGWNTSIGIIGLIHKSTSIAVEFVKT